MSFTGVKIGYGAVARIGRGATPVWTTIPGVGDFSFPAGTVAEVDATSHSSPGQNMEFIPGLGDNGSLTLPHDWIPGSAVDVLLRVLRRTREMIQLELTPAGTTSPEIYACFVSSYERVAPVAGKATANTIFRLNGIVSGEPDDPDEDP